MSYNPERSIISSLSDFYQFTETSNARNVVHPTGRIVHCVNPFPAAPGTEHDRAQKTTFASMERARKFANAEYPNLQIDLAKVTLAHEDVTTSIDFDRCAEIPRTVQDLKDFKVSRPFPLVMDVLQAIDIAPNDIFIFTNVDIAVTAEFYGFIAALFNRGADCAIVNRRTISDAYKDEHDVAIMSAQVGEPHPGYDCFAFRGHLRDSLPSHDSCVGIAGVMLPLVHHLIATAQQPVVLLDAHATYHLGNDQQWKNSDFEDYAEHNRAEFKKAFLTILADPLKKERFLARVSGNSKHAAALLPKNLRRLLPTHETQTTSVLGKAIAKVKSSLRF